MGMGTVDLLMSADGLNGWIISFSFWEDYDANRGVEIRLDYC